MLDYSNNPYALLPRLCYHRSTNKGGYMSRKLQKQSGFTLLELLIIIVAVVILVVVIVSLR